MDFDPDVIGRMLYQAHVAMTMSPDAFAHKVSIANRIFDPSVLPNDPASSDAFIQRCYEKFDENRGSLGRGSVDIDPNFWVTTALKTIQEALNKGEKDTITFPNGCCTQAICCINKLYDVVVDELFKQA